MSTTPRETRRGTTARTGFTQRHATGWMTPEKGSGTVRSAASRCRRRGRNIDDIVIVEVERVKHTVDDTFLTSTPIRCSPAPAPTGSSAGRSGFALLVVVDVWWQIPQGPARCAGKGKRLAGRNLQNASHVRQRQNRSAVTKNALGLFRHRHVSPRGLPIMTVFLRPDGHDVGLAVQASRRRQPARPLPGEGRQPGHRPTLPAERADRTVRAARPGTGRAHRRGSARAPTPRYPARQPIPAPPPAAGRCAAPAASPPGRAQRCWWP